MSGWKQWVTGELVRAADLQSYIANQVVAVFPTAAERDATILAPTLGQTAYLTGSGALTVWTGAAWKTLRSLSARHTFHVRVDYELTTANQPAAACSVNLVPFGFTAPPVVTVTVQGNKDVVGQRVFATLHAMPTATVAQFGLIAAGGANLNTRIWPLQVHLSGPVTDLDAASALNGTTLTASTVT